MPIQVRYPSGVPAVDASGLINSLSDLGDRYQQKRQNDRYAAEAAEIFSRMQGPNTAAQPMPTGQQPTSLASLASLATGGQISRSELPPVADDAASLRVKAAHNVSDPMAGYFQAIRSAESGGDDLARNPNSSATGRYQFTEGTWNDLMRSNPALGLTADGRTDPRQQEAAVRAFTTQNARSLSQGGVGVNPGSLYAAHFLGAGGAVNAYGQEDATPMASVVGPEVIQANPFLGNMTVGDFKNWAGEKVGYRPSQQALEGMSVGQSLPMQGGAADAGQRFSSVSTGGYNLDPALMKQAFANPLTRPIAIQMATSRLAAMQDQSDPMKRVAYEKALLELDQLRRGEVKPTDDMREYQYSLRDPGFAEYQQNQRRASATNVNVGSEKGYDKTVGEGYGKRFLDIQDGAQTAQRALNALDVMEQSMADPNFYSGAASGSVTALKRYGRALGIEGAEGIDSIETFNAMAKQAALDSMGGSLGSGFSNADRDFVLDQVPNLQNTPEGNAQLIGIQRKLNERRQQVAQLARQYASGNGGRIDAGFDDQLSQWSQANPLFPPLPAGSGATPGAGGANGRQRARNPQTGETMEWDGQQWSPVR